LNNTVHYKIHRWLYVQYRYCTHLIHYTMDIAWDIKKYKQKGTFLKDGSFVWRQYKKSQT
jgi:hypothetical protein